MTRVNRCRCDSNWVTPQQKRADYQAAVAAAKSAATVVVFAWSRNEPVMALPGDQDRLIGRCCRRESQHHRGAQYR